MQACAWRPTALYSTICNSSKLKKLKSKAAMIMMKTKMTRSGQSLWQLGRVLDATTFAPAAAAKNTRNAARLKRLTGNNDYVALWLFF